jgi:hypothetical protein
VNQKYGHKGLKVLSEKRLYTIKELVREIGATEWFWRSQIWDGRLPYVQVGRKMFVENTDIDNFIRDHKKTDI